MFAKMGAQETWPDTLRTTRLQSQLVAESVKQSRLLAYLGR